MGEDRLRIVGTGADADDEVVRAQLRPFVASANRFLDRRLAERNTQPVPALRLPNSRRRVIVVAAGALLAAAAALVALFIAPRHSAAPAPDDGAEQAAQYSRVSDTGEPLVAPSRVPEPTGDDDARDDDARAPADTSTLRDLDAEAQRRWRAGDLEGATELLRRVTTLGGDHRYVELAFADLVTLSRQRGRSEQVAALWREYLERFPRGRFSVDARVIACALADAPAACSAP